MLWREILNIDGQLYHQYQQNDQSQLTNHIPPTDTKKTLKDYWISNGNRDKNER
jgi:hypothetical protein